MSSAIAALCANGLFVSQAHAVADCGPTVSSNQGQCTPYFSDTVVVQEGVTVSASDTPAVLYFGNLGEDTGGSGVLGSFTNNGSILSSGLGEDSFTFSGRSVAGVQINGNLLGNLTNNGLISATSTDDVYRVVAGVNMQSLSGTLNNHGTITADVAGSGGGQAVGVRISNMSGGELNNYGTIEGVISSSDVGQAYSIYALNAEGGGTINNRPSGVLRGHLYSGGSSVNVTNAGTIDLPMDSFAGYVSGDFTQTDSGVLRLMASGDGEDEYSQMFVGGTASIAGTAFVDVQELNTLEVGQTLSRVLGASELTGNFAQVDDNSALFNFQSIATEGENGHIDFKLVKALTAVDAVDSNNNPSARGAAGALDTIIDRGTTNPNMQTLIDALGQLGTSQEVSDAISQTTPLLTANTVLASRAALGGISRVIESRIASNRGMSSGDEFYGDRNVWLKPFGSWAGQDDRSGISGFDANTSGIVLGADGTVSDSTRVGVAFAYANSNIDGNSNVAPNSADVDMYQLLGYGSHSLDQNTELNFQVGIGQNNTQGKRDIRFLGETAKADYSSRLATAGIGLARTFELSEKTAFTPSVRTDYTWIKDESYTEKGSSANLKVDSQTTDQMIVGLDGKLSHEFMPGTSVVANLGVGYDVLNNNTSITSAFAAEPGTGFTTRGLDSSPWSQRSGLGLIHSTEQGVEVSLRYDTEHSEGFLNQTASVKLRWDI
ncbi:autotransporter outer membrane beta-barrel domain-containing protein [Pseudomonas sp. WS 5011]|uniref:autotransporter family protein n=1 Tax=Pseudomonas sp. WS 5011 TaxID=2717477 RepID=UPI001473FDFC|nr:autotransporter outer membrane beta-barrel domain-containing protein [Pseudomonas sp. WS 5011]NMY51222.1 autotransporter domain-containing protein [Pseudomonas sp. WS 5011]